MERKIQHMAHHTMAAKSIDLLAEIVADILLSEYPVFKNNWELSRMAVLKRYPMLRLMNDLGCKPSEIAFEFHRSLILHPL